MLNTKSLIISVIVQQLSKLNTDVVLCSNLPMVIWIMPYPLLCWLKKIVSFFKYFGTNNTHLPVSLLKMIPWQTVQKLLTRLYWKTSDLGLHRFLKSNVNGCIATQKMVKVLSHWQEFTRLIHILKYEGCSINIRKSVINSM